LILILKEKVAIGRQLKSTAVREHGRASTEYILTVFVALAVIVALAGLFGYFAGAGSEGGSHSAKTYARAPYTLPSGGTGSEQWAKDLIIH